MDIQLRDYQTECIKRVLAAYAAFRANPCKETRDALLVLPVAAGKTIIFSEIILQLAKLYGLNALIIAHTDTLLDQAADKYRMVKPDAVIGKVGSGRHEYGGEVTVASVATISRPEHIKRLQAIGYGLIVTDEAHRSAAVSYQTVYEALPNAFHLMVTATPDRLDGKPISDKPPLYSASIIDMIQQGYLCDVKAIAIRTNVNLDELHTQMGDFKTDELEEAIDTTARNRRVVEAYKEHCSDRRAICFCVTVKHAHNLSASFSVAGIPSSVISGDTPIEERNRLYKALQDGSIRVLTNVNVLTEGFDLPLVNCVIAARPTQSRVLFIQSLGRGLRLAPGKADCILLDITDNCLKHRLEPQTLSKVLGKKIKDNESLTETLAREESERETQVRKLPEKRASDIHINLLEKLLWQSRSDGKFVLEVDSHIYKEEIDYSSIRTTSKGEKVANTSKTFLKHRIALVPVEDAGSDLWGQVGYYRVAARLAPHFEFQWWSAHAMPLDYAQQEAEKRARMLLADPKSVKLVDRNASWRTQPASEKQLESLAKYQARFHLQYDPAMITRGEASDMLDPVYEQFRVWAERKKKVAV